MVRKKAAGIRARQAAALLAGALVLELLEVRGSAPFYWTPLVLGLTYLLAAVLGGRRGGYWSTACVLVGWGAGVAIVGSAGPSLDTSGVYLAGAGLGALVGAGLARRAFDVDAAGMAATIVLGGLVLALSPQVGRLDQASTYVALLAVIAVINAGLAVAARGRMGGETAAP